MSDTPSRIAATDLAIVGSDVAEVARDSNGTAWGRWYSAEAGSWSPWWPIAKGAEAVAVAGPYGTGALVTVARWAPDPQDEATKAGRPLKDSTRGMYLLSASGVTGTQL